MQKNLGLVLFLLMTNVALAQQSASYKVAEYAFNAAGHPVGGHVLGSPSFLVRSS